MATICLWLTFVLKRISNWVIVTSIEWNETPQFELIDSIWSKTARLRTLLVPSVAKEMKDTWIASWSFDRTIKRGSYTSCLTMHSKSHKICTLKFLGCYLAQRVHGSKVEAKESTKNSKVLNWMSWNQVYSVGWSDTQVLTCVGWVLQPTDSKWTVGWTDGTGIGSPDALGFSYSSGHGSALKH
jgi:hypothetical protein